MHDIYVSYLLQIVKTKCAIVLQNAVSMSSTLICTLFKFLIEIYSGILLSQNYLVRFILTYDHGRDVSASSIGWLVGWTRDNAIEIYTKPSGQAVDRRDGGATDGLE